jgi:hypothetical protein
MAHAAKRKPREKRRSGRPFTRCNFRSFFRAELILLLIGSSANKSATPRSISREARLQAKPLVKFLDRQRRPLRSHGSAEALCDRSRS